MNVPMNNISLSGMRRALRVDMSLLILVRVLDFDLEHFAYLNNDEEVEGSPPAEERRLITSLTDLGKFFPCHCFENL